MIYLKKITKIEVQKKNKHRYSVYINDSFEFGINEEVLLKYGLEVGSEIDEYFIENILKSEEQSKAKNYALNLLSYRQRSEKEISRKMRDKGYENNIIDNTIKFLEKNKLLNDREFAKSFIRDKVNIQKWGRNRIRIELYRKGVNKELINEVIEEEIEDELEYETAKKLALKKISTTYKKDEKRVQYRKLYGFLQRKGYKSDIISRVLSEIIK